MLSWDGKAFSHFSMNSQYWRMREGRCHGWWQATGPHSVHNEPVRSWKWSWKCLELLCKLLVLGVFLNYLSAGHPSVVFVCTLSAAASASKSTRKLPFPIPMQLIVSDACFYDIYYKTQILTGLMHCKKDSRSSVWQDAILTHQFYWAHECPVLEESGGGKKKSTCRKWTMTNFLVFVCQNAEVNS